MYNIAQMFNHVILHGVFLSIFIVGVFSSSLSAASDLVLTQEATEQNNITRRLGIENVAQWPFGPCYDVVVDASRQLAFCSSGSGVFTVNIASLNQPVIVSEDIHCGGYIYGLLYSAADKRLYITSDRGGLEIWNVNDAQKPVRMGSLLIENAYNVIVRDGFAYVSDMNEFVGAVTVVNVTDPHSPLIVSRYVTYHRNYGMCISGDYLAVASTGGGVNIFNVSDPSNLSLVGQFTAQDFQPTDVRVSGTSLYIIGRHQVLGGVFGVLNVSDPANPQLTGFCYVGESEPFGLEISPPYAAVAAKNDGIVAIDFSNNQMPKVISRYNTPGTAVSLTIYGTSVFVPDFVKIPRYRDTEMRKDSEEADAPDCMNGLRIIDFSSVNDPREIGFIERPTLTGTVFGQDDYIYVGTNNSRTLGEFRILQISADYSITQVGYLTIGNNLIERISVCGSKAYLITSSQSLLVVDLTDKQNPSIVGSIGIETISVVEDLIVYAHNQNTTYAILATGENEIKIFNVSDPANGFQVAYIPLGNPVYGLCKEGTLLYLANAENGVTILDLADPTNPRWKTGHVIPEGAVKNIAVSENYLYTASSDDKIHIINVANPDDIFETGSYAIGENIYKIKINQQKAYITTIQNTENDSKGYVRVLNIADPANITEDGFHVLPYYLAADLFVAPAAGYPTIYIANEFCGVQVFKELE